MKKEVKLAGSMWRSIKGKVVAHVKNEAGELKEVKLNINYSPLLTKQEVEKAVKNHFKDDEGK